MSLARGRGRAFVGAMLAVLVAAPAAHAAFPGRNGKLAFVRGENVHVMSPGGTPTPITSGAGASDPAWSPDGTRIAFVEDGEIFVIGAPGGTPRPVTTGVIRAESPSWSPDGRKIAFSTAGTIFTIPAAGGTPTPITVDAIDSDPAWSPDGRRIAFTRGSCANNSESDIYVTGANGGPVAPVTNTSGSAGEDQPTWSPDGERIAYRAISCSTSVPSTSNSINVVSHTGGGAKPVASGPGFRFAPAWSPDGTRIAFSLGGDVFTVPATGGTAAPLTSGPSTDEDPDYQRIRPRVSVSDATLKEGDAGTTNAVFRLSSSFPILGPIPVSAGATSGTALSGIDFKPFASRTGFAPKSTRATIAVPVNGDRVDEPDETFTLRLSNPFNATIADGVGVGRITDDDPLPPPVLGKTVNAAVASGRVFYKPPAGTSVSQVRKGRGYVELKEPRQLPVGSLVDTRFGRLSLTSGRTGRGAKTQTGLFWGGVFQVLQSRRKKLKGLTTLKLKGSARRCRRKRRKRRRARRSADAPLAQDARRRRLRRRAYRRLRGRSRRGRFRTRGRYSSATVRGTVWTTADRCDGTLTKVRRGKVVVRDFRRKKRVVLGAGKSYLARAG